MKEVEEARKYVRERQEAHSQTTKSLNKSGNQIADLRIYVNYLIKKIPELEADLAHCKTRLPESQEQLKQEEAYFKRDCELRKVQWQKYKLVVKKLNLMDKLQLVEKEIEVEA